MFTRNLIGALAAVAIIASPVAAASAPLPAPPIQLETVVGDQHFDGHGYVIPLLALVAILFGIWAALDDDEDRPTSP